MRCERIAGVDVSKACLDYKISGIPEVFRAHNTAKGQMRLAKLLQKHAVELVVLEATGGYESGVFKTLTAAGLAVALENPRRVRAFAHSVGRRAKSDLLDAEILMEYGQKVQPEPQRPVSEDVERLRELLTRRHQLTKMLVAEKNHAAGPGITKATRQSTLRVMLLLRKEIKSLDEQVQHIIERNQELSEKATKLLDQTGVGPVLMSTILADMPELGTLARNEASALAGVAPYDRDSGTFKGKRAIAGGRVRVRCALYMATLAAVRHDKHLKAFYKSLVSRGKPHKVALVACMRKFIIHLNSVLKENPDQHFMAD